MPLQMLSINEFPRTVWTSEVFYAKVPFDVASVHRLRSDSYTTNVANRMNITILQLEKY